MRILPRLLPLSACLLAACAPARHTARLPTPEPYTTDAGAYTRRLRDIIKAEHPRLLTESTGHARFVYLRADAGGRVERSVVEDTPPQPLNPWAMVGRIVTRDEADRWIADTTVSWGVMGMSMHGPGVLAADTVWVFWAAPPMPIRTTLAGTTPLGMLAQEQNTPARIRALAARMPPGHSVWYVHDDQQRILGYGTWPEANPNADARRAELAPRFADGRLTCYGVIPIRAGGGRMVTVMPVRYQPLRPAAAAASNRAPRQGFLPAAEGT